MAARRGRHNEYLYSAAAFAAAIVVVLFLVNRPYDVLDGVIRAAATIGYLGIFASIVSTAYLRPLVRFFGRSFIKVHHAAAVTALIMATVHPIAVLFAYGQGILLPVFRSFAEFLRWAGPWVWLLLVISATAALLRSRFRRGWRAVHALTFVAFWLATAHGALLGTDGNGWGVRVVMIAMAIVVLFVATKKRREAMQRHSKSA